MNLMIISPKCLLAVGVACSVFGLGGCISVAMSKSVGKTDSKVQIEKAIEEAKRREVKLRPAFAYLVKGDYKSARTRFEELEAEGFGNLGRQRVRCLLAEGKIDEGLRLLSKLGQREISPEQASDLRVALLVKGRRKSDLKVALQKIQALPSFESSADGKDAINPSPSVADRLLAVAVHFGRQYDRETMHLVGTEALRRGPLDPSALLEYAATTASNGDVRKAKKLYQKLLKSKPSPLLSKTANGSIYDLTNYIGLVERDRPIGVEEAMRHKKYRKTFFLSSWQ